MRFIKELYDYLILLAVGKYQLSDFHSDFAYSFTIIMLLICFFGNTYLLLIIIYCSWFNIFQPAAIKYFSTLSKQSKLRQFVKQRFLFNKYSNKYNNTPTKKYSQQDSEVLRVASPKLQGQLTERLGWLHQRRPDRSEHSVN